MCWHFKISLPDVVKQLLFVAIDEHKRRLTSEHLIYDAADAPPVDSESVSLSINDLWCKILWSSTEGQCIIVAFDIFFRKSEICQLCIPILVYKDIFGFQISINNLVLVQVVNC